MAAGQGVSGARSGRVGDGSCDRRRAHGAKGMLPVAVQRPVLWRHAGFLKLWAGQTISEFGSGITYNALPLAAVLTLGASSAQLGLLMAAASAPAVVAGLFAGLWVDRLRRRPLLIATD